MMDDNWTTESLHKHKMERRARLKSTDDERPLITDEEAPQLTEEPLTEIEIIEAPQLTEEPLTEIEIIEAPQLTEEPLTEIEIIDSDQLIQEQTPHRTEPPPLIEGELYHVFLSYSSTDSEWTESLMEELESRGLKVCCHLRDFTAGRSILENMSECITQSQKVLLVLSPDFVNSRWCLMEANMSLFRDCLQMKTIVPVLLRPVSIPPYLAHITYLEPQHPDFTPQLLRVLCKPNKQQQDSSGVPYQPQSLYNGKSLQPLIAVNEETLNMDNCGLWSAEVPDQLRQIIQEPQRYLQAIGCINKVKDKAWFSSPWVRNLFVVIASFVGLTIITLYLYAGAVLLNNENVSIGVGSSLFIILTCLTSWLLWKLCIFKKTEAARIVRELQSAVGRANSLLWEENILMGCVTNSKLYLVYVCLDDCRSELSPSFPFHKALLRYSCAYTCCLARRHFPFAPPPKSAHLAGGICFCQYVLYILNQKKDCSFSRLWESCSE